MMMKRRHSFLSVFPMLPIINFIFLSHYYVHRQQNLTTTAKSVKRFKQNYRDRKIDFFYSRQNLKKIIKKYSLSKSENTFLQNVNGKPLYFLLSDKVFLYWLTTLFLTLNLEEGDKSGKSLNSPLRYSF